MIDTVCAWACGCVRVCALSACWQVPWEAAEASFLEKGWPAWQVVGLLELLKQVDSGAYGYADEDFKTVTGKDPTSVQQWVEAVKLGFQ